MSLIIHNREIQKYKISELLKRNIVIPEEIQRIITNHKVDEIVKKQLELLKKGLCEQFLGVINIHYCKEREQEYLLDGQHRYEAMKRLYTKHSHNVECFVEYVKVENYVDLKDNYKLINENTPLPDFPDHIDKNLTEKVINHFQTKYEDIWSKNSRARRPHIYFNYFQETVGYLVDTLKITDPVELIKIIEDYNQDMSKWPMEQICSKGGLNSQMYAKAKETGVYLGYYTHSTNNEWGYDWACEIVKRKTGKKPVKFKVKRKKKIPKSVKIGSWNRYIGKTHGEVLCIICNNHSITQSNFEAGHILSEKNGGDCSIDNIIPICSNCNKSVGILHMDEYVKEYYPNNYHTYKKRTYSLVKVPSLQSKKTYKIFNTFRNKSSL